MAVSKTGIALLLLGVLAAFLAALWYVGKRAEEAQPPPAPAEGLGSALSEKLAEPIVENLPPTNPFAPDTNPFTRYRNPFDR